MKDLYISCGYPPATVMSWIKGLKEVVYKNRLDWTFNEDVRESECIWPLKSVMNPVWQKLNLGMVTKSMCSIAAVICDEERALITLRL